jgi:hypothetical protein
MALLGLTSPRELLARLPGEGPPELSIVRATARENADGTWSVSAYADEDLVPALEALGHTVVIVESDAALIARYDEIQVQERPNA